MPAGDVEIYVRDCPMARLVAWVDQVVGPLGEAQPAGIAVAYTAGDGAVVVTPGMEDGPFVSVWFNMTTPWANTEACARAAAEALGCTVLDDLDDARPPL